MNIFEDLNLTPNATECGWHKSIQGSFLFMPSAGVRMSSDDLVIELYREVFFEKRSEGANLKRIDPEETQEDGTPAFEEDEKKSLYMSRGRKKKTARAKISEDFYMPLYPSLARRSWLRQGSERGIKRYLLNVIAQHLSTNGAMKDNFIEIFYKALLGKRDGIKDISGLKIEILKGCVSEDEGRNKLSDLCGEAGRSIFKLQNKKPDVLSETIFNDLKHLCELEEHLDRLQWMSLLKTFLGFSTSVWLLSQMKITITLRDKLLSIMSGHSDLNIDEKWVDEIIQSRHHQLFKPTMAEKKYQLEEYVQQYVKARNELNVLVALVEKYSPTLDWSDKTLTLHEGPKSDLGILELMASGFNMKSNLANDLNGSDLRVMLTRHCESFSAWRAPVNPDINPPKSYCEYLRTLRKMDQGDDGGYLIIPNRQKKYEYRIFPGNLMLRLITYLAAKVNPDKKLILADVENHFKSYGLDFGEKGEIRGMLIKSLQDMGLLKGSPDADDSVAVENPYPVKSTSV